MKSKFLDYKGEKIAYKVRGKKGKAIVFLHGFLGSKELWEDYSKRLSKTYRVITIDLLGHGESGCIGYVHSMEENASMLKELLNSLRIRKIILAGHSMGGYVALAFAELFPDNLNGLILINSSASADCKKKKSSRNKLISLIKNDKQKAIDLLIPTFFESKKLHRNLILKYKRLAHLCSKQAIIASIEGMKIRKEREIILHFAPYPILFVIGKRDCIVSPIQLLDFNTSEKELYVEELDCGHMSMMEKPEKVFRVIKQFLNLK